MKKPLQYLVVFIVALGLIAPGASAKWLYPNKNVEVMTRNLYLGADDPKVGRHKVTYFASQRVARMYPDLTAGERAEIQEESRKIMDAVDAERSGEDESNKLRFYRG